MNGILDRLANTSTSVQERARFLREEINNNPAINVRQIREDLVQHTVLSMNSRPEVAVILQNMTGVAGHNSQVLSNLVSSFVVPDMAYLLNVRSVLNQYELDNNINYLNDIRDIINPTPHLLFNNNIINSFNDSSLDIDRI